MTFGIGFFVFLIFIIIGIIIMGTIMSVKPSEKYGHTLKAKRISLSNRVKKTGIGQLPSNVAYQVRKKIKDMGKEKPEDNKPKVKLTEPKNEPQQQKNRAPEKGENPWHTAFFYYEQSPVTNKPCGEYRIGDKYKADNGKEYTILFDIEPYKHQGQMYLGVSNPHLTDKAYKEIDDYLNNRNKHQISYEPQTFQKAYSH